MPVMGLANLAEVIRTSLSQDVAELPGAGAAGGLGGMLPASATDIDGYVTSKTLDGLFLMIAREERKIRRNPLHGQVAAVSVGIYKGVPVLDLDYAEDSEAETDMNIVMNDAGRFIEVQGTAEGHAFTDDEFAAMIGLARAGIETILVAQDEAIASASK